MSLPEANKEISNNPGKLSVTSPTDKAAMHADVDRKMRFYGVIQAFRENRYPDNAQIDETLTYLLQSSPIDEKKLSAEGRRLIGDVRDIIETARLMVKQKNADELFQNFLFHTTHTDAQVPKADTDATNLTKDGAKDDGRQAVEHLRTLMKLILTNSEARKLLSDAQLIGRDFFARGAVKAAETVRPNDEQLARVDDAAPADQWKAPDGTILGPNDRAPDLLSKKDQEKLEEAKQTASVGANAAQGHANGIAIDAARQPGGADAKTDAAQSSAIDRLNTIKTSLPNQEEQKVNNALDSAQQLKTEVDAKDSTEAKADTAKQGLKDRLVSLKDKIPGEHRDTAKAQYQKGVDFLKDEFPEERRDQYIYRLKKVIVECQKHQDYQEALTWFLSAIETYFGHGKTVATSSKNNAGGVVNDPSLNRAATELRTLLERFANGKSIQGILDAGDQLYQDAQNDEALKNWFRRLDTYVRKVLLEPGYILAPASDTEARQLREDGRAFFDDKYKAHKDNLFDQIQSWFVAFHEDPTNRRFGEDWKRLTRDLLFAEDGSLSFKPHLWSDVRKVIIPTLVKDVGYIPIPRIEYTDNMIDLVIENLTLEGTNLLPNIISVEAHNFFEFSPYASIKDTQEHDFKFSFSQVQADMRDVAFYFKKKSGIPKISDHGLADVFLGGSGLTVKVHLQGAGKDSRSVFKVKDVNVKIDSLKFSIRDSKHDLLYKTLKPLATGLVKKQISKAISEAIQTGLEYLDEQLVAVRDRYSEARNDPDVSATQTFGRLFEKKAVDAASAAESVKEKKEEKNAKFQIVSKRDSILVPKGHEMGWINKVSDRDLAAKQGDGWKSHAFNIVPGAHAPAKANTGYQPTHGSTNA